jgi:cystathionine beta-lyase
VVADEVHAPLVRPDRRHVPYATVSDAAAVHSVTVTSASKAFNLAGLKCAQLVATNHDDAVRLRNRPVFEIPGPTPLGISASTAAYRDGRPWLHDLVAYVDGNHRRLAELLEAELPRVGHRPSDATFLAWLDCTALGLDDPADHFLRRARVALSDGPPFGAGYERFVRLNLATSRALLERIVGAMSASIRS